MKTVFKLSVWMIAWMMLYVFQVQDRTLQRGEGQMYGAAIVAAHDAAVESIMSQEDGFMTFDPVLGTAAYKKSLAVNVGLDPITLVPNPNTLLREPVKIIGLFFLGDDKAPKDGAGSPQYPYTFSETATYRGQTILVKETIYGPSVVSVIEFTHDVMTPIGRPVTYKKATYRYWDRAL
ncbi:hypothetical protein [Paenibacillus mesotrionivorans]|uniref:Uncharacterized protein n=1 Tax=Paenibacillus mesotrionivorans TaxID=3160968 RepID=A0ACC7NW99_9BACL